MEYAVVNGEVKPLEPDLPQEVALLCIEIQASIEKGIEKPLREVDRQNIVLTVLQNVAEGETDAYLIFYRCLLALPDFEDERDAVRFLIAKQTRPGSNVTAH